MQDEALLKLIPDCYFHLCSDFFIVKENWVCSWILLDCKKWQEFRGWVSIPYLHYYNELIIWHRLWYLLQDGTEHEQGSSIFQRHSICGNWNYKCLCVNEFVNAKCWQKVIPVKTCKRYGYTINIIIYMIFYFKNIYWYIC